MLLGAMLTPCVHHLSTHDLKQVPEGGYTNVILTLYSSSEQIIYAPIIEYAHAVPTSLHSSCIVAGVYLNIC